MAESSHTIPQSGRKNNAPWRARQRPIFYWLAAFIGVLWVDLFLTLSVEWEINQQYSYGYLVPFLGAYLIYLRWENRPVLDPPGGPWLFPLAAGGVLLALLPARIIFEANPDWRLIMWTHAGLVWALSLVALFQLGGKPWLAHFAPAFTFFLLAVPWPVRLETPVIQGLMRLVAMVAVEFLNLMGIYAQQYGNLIKLPTALVGVEEACSGVRSIQSAIMAGFFFGEWFRMKYHYRAGLILAGLVLSVLLNLVRTITLTLVTHYRGSDTMDRWHDPVGYFVYFGSFILILILALVLRQPGRARSLTPAPRGGLLRGPATGCPGIRLLQGLLAAWVLSLGMGWAYYTTGNPEVRYRVEVTPRWNTLPASAVFPEISPNVEALLRFDEGKQAAWRSGSTSWTLFFFTWDAGSASSFGGVHRPEICLQAAGLILHERGPTLDWHSGEFGMEVKTYTFKSGETPYHVFFAVWEKDNGRVVPINQSYNDRLANVVSRQRSGSRQSIELVITGMPNLPAATRAAKDFFDQMLAVEIET